MNIPSFLAHLAGATAIVALATCTIPSAQAQGSLQRMMQEQFDTGQKACVEKFTFPNSDRVDMDSYNICMQARISVLLEVLARQIDTNRALINHYRSE